MRAARPRSARWASPRAALRPFRPECPPPVLPPGRSPAAPGAGLAEVELVDVMPEQRRQRREEHRVDEDDRAGQEQQPAHRLRLTRRLCFVPRPPNMAAMSTAERRWTTRKIVLLFLGMIAVLIALGLLAGGGGLLWSHEKKRDADGLFSTSIHHVDSRRYAVATDSLDIATSFPRWLLGSRQLARIRIQARSERPLFIGIARAADVESYLGNVSYTGWRTSTGTPCTWTM